MILVTLGTQDKPFNRILEELDKDLANNLIKDEVIVQAGNTKFESKNMKIFDFVSMEELEKLIKKCDLLITHGGVGSIISGLKNHKKVIGVARLKRYGEHINDHQLQILENFDQNGYIMHLKNIKDLPKLVEKSKKFTPKEYKSNTNNIVDIIDNFINNN